MEESVLQKDAKSLDAFKEIIALYDDAANRIPLEIDKTEFVELFEVRRDYFINSLFIIVNEIRDSIINRLLDEYESTATK